MNTEQENSGMETFASLIRAAAPRIVAAGAELTDGAACRAALENIVEQLAEGALRARPVKLDALRNCGTDEALVGRVLRAIEAETIEVLREASAEPNRCQWMLSLRQCVRNSIPKPQVNPRDLEFFRDLLEGTDAGAPAERGPRVRFLHNVMNSLNDMLYVHDLAGNILFINKYGLKLTKFTAEDLAAGMTIYDFVVSEYLDLVEVRLHDPDCVRTPFIIEIYAKDGERIPVEISARAFHEHGQIMGIFGIAHDARLERRLEAEIRRSNAHLQSIFSSAPIGIITMDASGVITDANPTAVVLCGATSLKDIVGSPLRLICDDAKGSIERHVAEVLKSRMPVRQRCSVTTRFGVAATWDVTIAPVGHGAPGPDGALLLLTDVSEKIGLQQQLLQSEKLTALGEIIAGVAHELNNPLTGILGYAQFLLGSVENPGLRQRLEHIADEAQRCRHIVQNLLSFARRQESKKSLQDVNRLLADTVALLEYQLRADEIELTLRLDPDLPKINASPADLQRVLLNIITNAHQALATVHERRRLLHVTSGRHESAVYVEIADNGPGIREEIQSRVFDPFFTTRTLGEGTGLGLSVAYGIVHDHGGHIQLESQEGAGATFTVVLPIAGEKR